MISCYKKSFLILSLSFVVFAVLIGCGAGKKKLEDAENRIKALEARGIPDSLLSSARVFLFQATSAKKTGSSAYARKYTDSLVFYLEKAEVRWESTMQKMKPIVDSLRKTIGERKKGLSGLQIKFADSIVAFIDSFSNQGWYLQAKDKCVFLDTVLPILLNDEKRMHKVRPRVIGIWVSSRVPTGGYKAIETRKFTFKRDSTFHTVEQMKGQTDPQTKEDWKFLNWGKWEMKGDTVMMFVEREKCPRQTFWNYKKKDGRMQWVKYEAPTYDTTITDHKKDRYVAYKYLLDFFKKK